MSAGQVNSGFDLLGLADARPSWVKVSAGLEPKLDVAWGDFRQSLWSSVRALFSGPFTPRKFLGGDYFKDCWVERRIPKRAVVAAALWHVVFFVSPFSLFDTPARRFSQFDNTQLTWSGPIEDFPALEIAVAKPKPKPAPAAEAAKPPAPPAVDAFHPRQRIVTDPVRPNHPRQTLINPKAPQIAPKFLPQLPNIVQLQAAAAPARPRMEISADALAKLHPRQHRAATTAANPAPDVLSPEQKPAELSLAVTPNAPARPKLDLNANSAPRVAQHAQAGDSAPAPELVAAQSAAANGAPATLIALSAAPAPPKPEAQPPAGNLAARAAMSPEGKGAGVAGAPKDASPAANAANSSAVTAPAGKSGVGVSISGGNPQPKTTVSGLGGGRLSLPSSRALLTRPEPKSDDAPQRTGPPNFAILPPGAKPEQIFAAKRVYTLAVNMANLNSASGSWILHFAELGSGQGATPSAAADLSMPEPMRKVDPKYPPDLIEQNVQGEVVLYAIIRANGTVDSIQVVRSLDPQLDANAKSAFAQWKFIPAAKAGTPVDIEAIAHIPFKIRDDR